MNFHAITWRTAIATAMVAGSAVLMSAPAQALSIASGSVLNFGGSVSISGDSSNHKFDFLAAGLPTDPGIPGDIDLGLSTLSFAGVTEVPGGAKITDLATSVAGGGFSTAPIVPFLTGLKLTSGEVVSFNLNSFSDFTAIIDGGKDDFGITGGTISGFFSSATGSVLGRGILTAQFTRPVFTGVTTYSASIEAIPTPALLPGVIGMGIAAIRKRKAKQEVAVEKA